MTRCDRATRGRQGESETIVQLQINGGLVRYACVGRCFFENRRLSARKKKRPGTPIVGRRAFRTASASGGNVRRRVRRDVWRPKSVRRLLGARGNRRTPKFGNLRETIFLRQLKYRLRYLQASSSGTVLRYLTFFTALKTYISTFIDKLKNVID